jgi:Ca2+-binding RTX toxin-like protein
MRTLLVALALGALAVATPANADRGAETCQGKSATIVQTGGTVNGTDGDDVIVGGSDTNVRAGVGDDTICVSGGRVEGGRGDDSAKVRGTHQADFIELRNVEEMDVRLGDGADHARVVWRLDGTPASGSLDGGGNVEDIVSAVSLITLEGVNIDLARERLILGYGELELSGFRNAYAEANSVRMTGGDANNELTGKACALRIRGGLGADRLTALDYTKRSDCAGAFLHGQRGDDVMRGSERGDYLIGGPGRDTAYGGKGVDSCVAVERERSCE